MNGIQSRLSFYHVVCGVNLRLYGSTLWLHEVNCVQSRLSFYHVVSGVNLRLYGSTLW